MDLCDRNDIQALLARHGFHFAKALGQNFLIRGDVAEDIAAAGCVPGCGVLEVGPGIGALTVQLARRAEKVVSVERNGGEHPIQSCVPWSPILEQRRQGRIFRHGCFHPTGAAGGDIRLWRGYPPA